MLAFSISAMKSKTFPPCLHSEKQFQRFLLMLTRNCVGVAAFVDGTRSVQAVGAALELVHEAVVVKHLLHGDGRFGRP